MSVQIHCIVLQKPVYELELLKTQIVCAMFLFIHLGNAKIAEILIKHGININYKDVYGCTPLHRAAEHGIV